MGRKGVATAQKQRPHLRNQRANFGSGENLVFNGLRKILGMTYTVVLPDGTIETRRRGVLHREDGPAVLRTNGTRMWYKNGKLHRDGGPALEFYDGSKEWWREGKRHRDDGPAIIFTDGIKRWYTDNEFVREERS